MLTVGSLFSGCEGTSLGLTAAGIEHRLLWVCDKDKAAAKVLEARFPGVPNLGDVTKVDWRAIAVPDLLTGGFPCQDVSLAGRRAGLSADTRSGLWLVMAEAIRVLRPRWVLIENTRGLLSARADSDVEPCPWCLGDRGGPDQKPALRALGAVLGDLSDLGYMGRWVTVAACDVGAAHERKRVFVLAELADAPVLGHGNPWAPLLARVPAAAVASDPADALLKTPTSQLAVNGGSQHPDKRKAGGHGPTLADEIEHLLPTAAASRSGRQRSASPGAAVRPSLDSIGKLLPTARASAGGPSAGRETGFERGANLGAAVLRPTARAIDGVKGGPNQRGSSGDLMLPWAVHQVAARNSAVQVEDLDALGTGAVGDRVWVRRPAARHQLDAESIEQGAQLALDLFGGDVPQVDGRDDSGQVLREGVHDAKPLRRQTQPQEAGNPHADWHVYAPAIQRWEAVIGRPAPKPTQPGARGGERLSPRFVEWFMGMPEGWVTDLVSTNDALRILGNAIVPQQLAYALRLLTAEVTR